MMTTLMLRMSPLVMMLITIQLGETKGHKITYKRTIADSTALALPLALALAIALALALVLA